MGEDTSRRSLGTSGNCLTQTFSFATVILAGFTSHPIVGFNPTGQARAWFPEIWDKVGRGIGDETKCGDETPAWKLLSGLPRIPSGFHEDDEMETDEKLIDRQMLKGKSLGIPFSKGPGLTEH